jgi:dihydroneopterin aldolase
MRPIASAAAGLLHVFLRDMVVHARVGIYPHEHASTQRIRINVDLGVAEQGGGDCLDRVVDYEQVANTVRRLATSNHVNLVETLAERIAAACLQDGRVRSARVRIEKLDVFEDAVSAGVEVERVAPRDSSTA